jgi:hypothetical protein
MAIDPNVEIGAHTGHALYRPQLPAEWLDLAQQQEEDFAQQITDDGGAENIIRNRGNTQENRALVQRRIRQISRALDTFGLFDRKGRLRVPWLTKLESLINTAASLDRLLGLERRQKEVPDDLSTWLETGGDSNGQHTIERE